MPLALAQTPGAGDRTLAVLGERQYTVRDFGVAYGVGRGLQPFGLTIVCPICGSAWASLSPARRERWTTALSLCVACPSSPGAIFPSGSLLLALGVHASPWVGSFQWESDLPASLLAREADLHLEWWAKHWG